MWFITVGDYYIIDMKSPTFNRLGLKSEELSCNTYGNTMTEMNTYSTKTPGISV